MYPMRRLILVFAIRTCYKCHFSCTYTAQLDPGPTACVTKFTLYISHDPKIVCVNWGDSPKIQNFSTWTVNDQFVSVVALSAPFNRQSLMVRYVYIRTVHNIGKKLVILLRGRAGWSKYSLFNEYQHIVSLALFWRIS